MKSKRSLIEYRGEECLNCGKTLEKEQKYCPECGQLNSTKKLALGDFFSEFFSGLFAYDSRFIRTMKILLFKPGKISKDYIEGKRMRYVNPYRFFLTTSIIFFIIYGYDFSFEGINLDQEPEEVARNLEEFNEKNNTNIEVKVENPFQNLDSIIKASSKDNLKEKETYRDHLITEQELDTMSFIDALDAKSKLFSSYFEETKNNIPADAVTKLDLKNSGYNHWLYKKVVDYNLVKQNPQLFINYLISKLPFIIFAFLPIFSLFLSLLYIRSKYNYMEHLTFAFHTQSMCFILYSIALIIDLITGDSFGVNFAHLIFIGYLFQGLRKFYQQGKLKTTVKFMILNIIFFTLAIIVGLISIFGSFAVF
ncbi:DUF3667 domain-containing protein [Zunongwangia sp. HGR-M22]|uniref:DUF3667 domain-containing protein n=1 Tax=Zunongwangia sp. HGR-M22 TaxID=3015168 RepID=UPI0022DD2DEA|nr:DUF3667 domain-containing protein [Zunongwangia sp. HGR-M22]WBL26525.1 DUF3667 domain-containing protein [Zunongwangia sp. HGR-M22]